MEFPPINLDFNDSGSIECKVVYKLTHSVSATNVNYLSKDNTELQRFKEKFKENNPHIVIEQTEYWGDGDDGSYYHYIDIYFSTTIWYDEIIKRNMRFTHNGIEYLVFWVNQKAEMRLMDTKTKKSWLFNPQTLSITRW